MHDLTMSGFKVQHYVVEIDGAQHSEHARFVDAIKEGLLLREQNPESKVAVRDRSVSKSGSEAIGPEIAAAAPS
jgi:hypothetical protein